MGPWEREQGTPPPSPLRQGKGSLSSMVVRPSDSAGVGGGASDFEIGQFGNSDRRNDDGGPPSPLHSRYRRFSEDSGYGIPADSISPLQQQKSDYNHYDPQVDQSEGPQPVHRSPNQWRPGNHDSDPLGRAQQVHGSPHQPRLPDDNCYDPDYDQPGRPHGHGLPRLRRLGNHRYDSDFDQPPQRGRGSPFQRRPDHRRYDFNFDQAEGPQHGRGLWRGRDDERFRDLSSTYGLGRGGGRFQDLSPRYGRGRGRGRFHDVSPPHRSGRDSRRFRDASPPYRCLRVGRLFHRGLSESGPGDMSFREGIHRNDPNLAPRVGDWICKDPSCGNLNFARRSSLGPPSPNAPTPRFSGRPLERGQQRDMKGYRSPHGWGRESPRGPPPSRHGGKFVYPQIRRGRPDYHKEVGNRENGRFDRPVLHGWNPTERGDFIHERRGYGQRPSSPRDRWLNDSRGRSRSPMRTRPPLKDYHRNSYMGRGRGGRWGLGPGRNNDAG